MGISFSDLIVAGAEKMAWGYNPIIGDLHSLFMFYILSYFLAGFVQLALKLSSAKGVERIQTRYVFLGFLIMVLVGVVTNLFVLGVLQNARYSWVGPYSTIFFVGFSTYAIIRHRLMSIEIIIKKSFVYSIVIGLFTGLYLAGIFLMGQYVQNVTGREYLFFSIFCIVFSALLFRPLQGKINQLIDQIFYRGSYDYQDTLKSLSKKIAAASTFDELNAVVSEEIKTVLKVENAKIQRF
jgi:hypothetical protein